MGTVRNFYNSYIKGNSVSETALIFAVIGIFMPFYISAVVILAVTVYAVINSGSRKKMFSRLDIKLIAAFFALNVVTPFVFKNYYGVACFFGVVVILVFALFVRSVITKELFSKASDVAAFMSICTAAVSTLIRDPRHNFRSPSVFFNPNYYGAMITFVIILCAYRLISKEGNRFFLIAAILMNVYGLFMADCQSAFFSIAFGIWLLLLLKKCYKAFAVTSGLAVIGIFLLPYFSFIMPRFSEAFDNIMRRSDIWLAGLKGFCDNALFGRGMMGYFQIFESFGSPKNFHCHNMFIDMLLSFGIIGSIPLVAFVVNSLKAAIKNKAAPLVFALAGSVILHGMVDVTLMWIQTGAFAVFLLSLPFAYKNDNTAKVGK